MIIADKERASEIIESYVPEFNENLDTCRKCGGRCCHTMGCDIFPQDVKKWFDTNEITEEMILTLLKSGYVQLDWWEGDVRDTGNFNFPESFFDTHDYYERCFYLHMRNAREPAISPSFGGTCRMLTKNGCALSWNMRPTGGKSLIPDPDGNPANCGKYEVAKPECALAWIKYEEILISVYNQFPIDPFFSMLASLIPLPYSEDKNPIRIPTSSIHTDEDAIKALCKYE